LTSRAINRQDKAGTHSFHQPHIFLVGHASSLQGFLGRISLGTLPTSKCNLEGRHIGLADGAFIRHGPVDEVRTHSPGRTDTRVAEELAAHSGVRQDDAALEQLADVERRAQWCARVIFSVDGQDGEVGLRLEVAFVALFGRHLPLRARTELADEAVGNPGHGFLFLDELVHVFGRLGTETGIRTSDTPKRVSQILRCRRGGGFVGGKALSKPVKSIEYLGKVLSHDWI
jgi:hypothetical protein